MLTSEGNLIFLSNKKQGSYRQRWESKPHFKGWLQSVPNKPHRAYCLYCKKKLHARKPDLLEHSRATVHEEAAQSYHNRNAKQPKQEASRVFTNDFNTNDFEYDSVVINEALGFSKPAKKICKPKKKEIILLHKHNNIKEVACHDFDRHRLEEDKEILNGSLELSNTPESKRKSMEVETILSHEHENINQEDSRVCVNDSNTNDFEHNTVVINESPELSKPAKKKQKLKEKESIAPHKHKIKIISELLELSNAAKSKHKSNEHENIKQEASSVFTNDFNKNDFEYDSVVINEALGFSKPTKKKQKSKERESISPHKHKKIKQKDCHDDFDRHCLEQDKEIINKSLELSNLAESKHKSKEVDTILSQEHENLKQEDSRVSASDSNTNGVDHNIVVINESLGVSKPTKKKQMSKEKESISPHKHKKIKQKDCHDFDRHCLEQDKEINNESLELSNLAESKHESKEVDTILSQEHENLKQEDSRVSVSDSNTNDVEHNIVVINESIGVSKPTKRKLKSTEKESISPHKHKKIKQEPCHDFDRDCLEQDKEIHFQSPEIFNPLNSKCKSKKVETIFSPKIEEEDVMNQVLGQTKRKRKSSISPHVTIQEEDKDCAANFHGDGVEPTYSDSDSDLETYKTFKLHDNSDSITFEVLLPFEISPLHQVSTRISCCPTKVQYQKLNNAGIFVKRGIFCLKEDNIIRANWEQFCKLHNVENDPTPFLSLSKLSTQKVPFVQFLGQNLGDRQLFSIYQRFQKLYQNGQQQKGRFTKEENRLFIKLLQKCKHSHSIFSDIADEMNRDRVSLAKHFVAMHKNQGKEHDGMLSWKKDLLERAISAILTATLSGDVEELRTREISNEEFKKASKIIDVPWKKLKMKWGITIYPGLFYSGDIMALKEELVKCLHQRGETDWKSVNWADVVKQFPGCTATAIYKIFYCTLYHVPRQLRRNLSDVLLYLKAQYTQIKGLTIQKLTFENGRLTIQKRKRISHQSKSLPLKMDD